NDVVLLGPSGRNHPPAGIPFAAHGQTTLIHGENLMVRLSPEPTGIGQWQPVRVTFDIPRDLHHVPLVIGPFPPVLINVGESVAN
ncbi:MAG: hypothetical protein KJ831_04425, partial [Candidatus Eisenbacteria bacterium]|nr:hypothetical protein [Candidatus Eisenbacteria bacterium]